MFSSTFFLTKIRGRMTPASNAASQTITVAAIQVLNPSIVNPSLTRDW